MFKPDNNFPTVSGASYHQITATFGTIFTANSQIKIRDLEVFRPVCFLDNNRVRICTIDTINKAITMNFQFALTVNNVYHVLFAIVDPRNPDVYGFLPIQSVSSIVVSYKLSGSSTVRYT